MTAWRVSQRIAFSASWEMFRVDRVVSAGHVRVVRTVVQRNCVKQHAWVTCSLVGGLRDRSTVYCICSRLISNPNHVSVTIS